MTDGCVRVGCIPIFVFHVSKKEFSEGARDEENSGEAPVGAVSRIDEMPSALQLTYPAGSLHLPGEFSEDFLVCATA